MRNHSILFLFSFVLFAIPHTAQAQDYMCRLPQQQRCEQVQCPAISDCFVFQDPCQQGSRVAFCVPKAMSQRGDCRMIERRSGRFVIGCGPDR